MRSRHCDHEVSNHTARLVDELGRTHLHLANTIANARASLPTMDDALLDLIELALVSVVANVEAWRNVRDGCARINARENEYSGRNGKRLP